MLLILHANLITISLSFSLSLFHKHTYTLELIKTINVIWYCITNPYIAFIIIAFAQMTMNNTVAKQV